MARASCDACGKSEGKLLRCGRCKRVWFCNRECQVFAARQGHSGANCRPPVIDGANAPKEADAEVAPRVPKGAGPITTAPGVNSASLAPAANVCDACGKSEGKLLRCGRCRNVWFCNRECQVVAARQGHSGANCRPADGAQRPPSSTNVRSPFAAPSQPTAPMNLLISISETLLNEANQAGMANTRVGHLAAVEKAKKAATVADLIGGELGAVRRTYAEQCISGSMFHLNDFAAGARAACAGLRSARATGSRTFLVKILAQCGSMATEAPDEMVKAERASREQERLSASPCHGSLDLSQEGLISLPTTPAGVSRLSLAYNEVAVATCDAALAAAGGRDSPAADDERRIPSLQVEAHARGCLGACLFDLGEGRQRSLELVRQAVTQLRRVVRTAGHRGDQLVGTKTMLCNWVGYLGSIRDHPYSPGMAEAEACLREALELSEEINDVDQKQRVLRALSNMSGRPDLPVGLTEAAAFRSRLNALYAGAGRTTDTSCTICLEPLEQPDGGAEQDDIGDGGREAEGYTNSAVRVLGCGHQFHRGCLSTWWHTASNEACPLCKK